MKKINLLLILSLLTVIFPFNVFANTFTNNDKEYKIVKADAACTKFEYLATGTDATVLYLDMDKQEPWLLSSDNTCTQVTIEDVIKNQDKYVYISYNVDFHEDGTASIYRTTEYQFVRHALVKSTVYDADKLYYINSNGSYEEVETSTEADLDKYYEDAFFKPALYELDSEKIYYKESANSNLLEKATNPENYEVGELYVLSSHENVVFDEVKTISNKLNTVLEQNTAQYVEVITTPTETAFYFIAYMNDTGSLANIYDENGNLLYEGVTSFTTALDELHIVYKDNKAYFYDLNQKLIHETSVFTKNVHEVAQLENVSLLSFRDEEIHFISSEVLSPSTTNPNTSDSITSAIIVFIIASLSLVGLVTYQTRNKRQN